MFHRLFDASNRSFQPSEAEKQTDTTSYGDSSSEEDDDSDYVVEEGGEASRGAQDSTQYCTRVQHMDLYRCTKCVFMHRFPSKVRRHYFYKHAKCYPYKCGHCTFEAVESGKIKRHCILMHDLLPIKVIKRQVDSTNDLQTLSEGVIMSDVRHENIGVINEDDITDDTDAWLSAYITKTNNDNRQQCRICGYVQLGASSVKRHVLAVHLKFYPYSCRYCCYSQVEINKVKKHIEHSHPGRPCCVVKRKLGGPPGEGDDVVNMESDDVVNTEGDDVDGEDVLVQDVSGGISPVVEVHQVEDTVTGGDADSVAQDAGDITCDEPADLRIDKVMAKPTSNTVEQDATSIALQPVEGATGFGLVEQPAGRDDEGNIEINKSVVMNIDRQSPDKHTVIPGDENEERLVDKADEMPQPGSVACKVSEETVTPLQSGDDASREHDTVSVGGQNDIVDISNTDISEDKRDQTTDAVLQEPATELTDVVEGESSDVPDTKGDSETANQDIDAGDSSTKSTDIPTSARIEAGSELSIEGEMTGMRNGADTADTSSGTQGHGVGSAGEMSGSGGCLGEHQEVDGHSKDPNDEGTMLPEVTSSDSVVIPSNAVESQTSAEKGTESLDDGEQQKGTETVDKNTLEDQEESLNVEQNSCVPSEQNEGADFLSDGDEDNDGGGADAEESEDFEGGSEDTHRTQLEETGNVSSRANSPTQHSGNAQIGHIDNVPMDLGTVTTETAGSSLPQMRHIKQETPATCDGYARHREEPILSMFANELAETAIKQEHSQATDLTNASLVISQKAEGVCPMNVRHVAYHQSLLKQRKVFLCVYCDYRSMYSPSDVRKHIFAVHMRRYPYRCSYCGFQNMKKFNVQKHTKKMHAGKLVVVAEAPVFRNNITVLESQGNKVNVGVVGADGIPVLDVDLLGPLLLQLDDSPTKDIPGKKWSRKPSVPESTLQDASSVPSSETEKESSETTAVPQWRCCECGLEAVKIGRVQVHVLTRHLKLRPYQCPYCAWGTWKTTPVEEHVRLKHPSDTVQVLENVQRKYTEIKKYIVAIPESEPAPALAPRVVAEVSPVQIGSELPTMHCDLCPYTASSQTRLQKHRKTHFSYRPFGCFHCEYTSFSRFKVRCHSSRVHKDKQVGTNSCMTSCTLCGTCSLYLQLVVWRTMQGFEKKVVLIGCYVYIHICPFV